MGQITKYLAETDTPPILMLERPSQYQIQLRKSENARALGITIAPSGREGILVSALKEEGMVSAWNRDNPSKDVRVGDRIVAVNGINGSHEQMKTEIAQAQALELTLIHHRRPAVTRISPHLVGAV